MHKDLSNVIVYTSKIWFATSKCSKCQWPRFH